MEKTENIDYEHLRNYAWNYFKYHASQRLTTFNFYIVISTLMATGYFLAIRFLPLLAIIFGIFIILLSFTFWKLDCRNRRLISYSINALKYIESKDSVEGNETKPNVLNIFTYDQKRTKEEKKTRWPWNKELHYSACFNTVFVSFGVLGFIAIIFAIINLIS